VLKYVSLSLTVAFVMWLPDAQIDATPSQPLLPYLELQTWTWPVVASHNFTDRLPPFTIVVSRTVDALQSDDVVTRMGSQTELTLSPSLSVNGFAVRAQW